MKTRSLLVFVVAALSVFLAACDSGAAVSPPNTLAAVKVSAISLDGSASIWANAPKMTVATKAVKKGEADGPIVTMQAVYDDKNVALRAEWTDSTDSWQRNAWTWDGAAWKRAGDQDRFAITFPFSNNADFSSKGCAAICHNQDTDATKWWMGTDSADVKLDMWQWQSASTNPVGQAADAYFGPKANPTATTGRTNDAIDGAASPANATADGKTPMYMSKNGTSAHYILKGEEVPLDMSKITPGTVIPGTILIPVKGSRGDVAAKGLYADTKWVVVLSRSLNTGNSDDAELVPPKPVPFGMAVFDNSGDEEHRVGPDVLTLTWK
jgi:ethylbenzene dehydrogenase